MTRKLEAYRLNAGRVRIDEVELADLLSASMMHAAVPQARSTRPPVTYSRPVRVFD